MSNTEPTKKPEVNAGAREGYTLMVGMINDKLNQWFVLRDPSYYVI